jgi:CheY-like chemotaxis protein/anti-sigma regulatory factor (Ser/Thr protein kinase)
MVTSDLDSLVVQADRQRLKQVLINLLSNAIKYNREGGRITVSATAHGDRVVTLEVADTGIGIHDKDLQRLFQPFDRLGAEQTAVEGVGVGLSVCRSLTEAMNGTIEAQSERGTGSTFSVTLPAGTLDLPGRPAPQLPSIRPEAGTVLYAEDNLATLRVVERLFDRRPEKLEVALQGRMLLSLAGELRPRLIILDLHLPDMTGEEVLHRLKTDPATADVPVVILSADATPGRLERLVDQGALACLTKPLNVPRLLAILDDLPVTAPTTS